MNYPLTCLTPLQRAQLALADIYNAHLVGELDWAHSEQLLISVQLSNYGNPN